MQSVADKLSRVQHPFLVLKDIKYYQDTVESRRCNFIRTASIITMIFRIIVSVIIVANTIKLTVFARSKEISIMKYHLGATDWFVRGPFLFRVILEDLCRRRFQLL